MIHEKCVICETPLAAPIDEEKGMPICSNKECQNALLEYTGWPFKARRLLHFGQGCDVDQRHAYIRLRELRAMVWILRRIMDRAAKGNCQPIDHDELCDLYEEYLQSEACG